MFWKSEKSQTQADRQNKKHLKCQWSERKIHWGWPLELNNLWTTAIAPNTGVYFLYSPDFLDLDWSLQETSNHPPTQPPDLKNTFHFNAAAAHEVICHLIMTKQTRRLSAVKCMYTKKRRWGGRRRPCGLDWTFKMESGSPATPARWHAEVNPTVVVNHFSSPIRTNVSGTCSQVLNIIFCGHRHLISRWLM